MNAKRFQTELQKPIDFLREQVRCLRSGGVTTQLVDTIRVNCYGQNTPIRHCAKTSRAPNGISVEPHDPNLVHSICKALKDAGLSAYVFSKTAVRVSVPPPSGEDRDQMRKRVRELGEEARIAVRQVRKSFKRKLDPKARGCAPHDRKKTSADERDHELKQLQEATDRAITQIDETVRHKIEVL